MATDSPGFAHVESQETRGEKLKLPEQNEPQREEMERVLLPFEVREVE